MSRRVISPNEAHRNARDLKRARRRIRRLEATLRAVSTGAIGHPGSGGFLAAGSLDAITAAKLDAAARCDRAVLATLRAHGSVEVQFWCLPVLEVVP